MKKTFIIVLIGILSCGTVLSAQTPPDSSKVNAGLGQFIEDLAKTAPSAAVNQNIYADAYIGKLIPSIPPHFAVGVNTSFSILDISGLKKAASGLGISLDLQDDFVLPTFTLDARIGGLFLPFDLGVSFMTFPTFDFGNGMKMDFLAWGADLRWALMQQSLIKPNISIGIGYYHNAGSIEISDSDSRAGIAYKVNTLALSAQVSKTFFIITPFIGGRVVMSDADSSYDWSASVASVNTGDSGSYKKEFGDFNQFNLYGGLSINIFVVRLTPSVSYDFANDIITATFSARVQL